ncbi:MAG: M23 family metallopeptidase [Deltaproteobacteria bacterium]|nr:M23 family metallopeptidase [Deltaproteobacteria bacterium]
MRSLLLLCALTSVAAAKPVVTISPKTVHPGDPVLVTVTGVDEAPVAKAGGQPLAFFAARQGFQAVFAVPLNIDEDHVMLEVKGDDKPTSIPVLAKKFRETKLVVEDEYANPTADDGKLIDADNGAIGATYAKAAGEPLFHHAFRQPRGAITGYFGEWRTFQDGHRAQHLGLDLDETEGSAVAAVNDGTVVLVRETFLAGNVVVIAHGAGIASMYFHLQKATVAEGDHVRQGERVGLVGHTGRTTGPHLHVGIRVHGGLVDPQTFFKLPLSVPSNGVARAP